jgi:hypothetical protein
MMDIAAAEKDVATADGAFSASLHDVSLAGRETAERVVSVVRPVVIGIGVVVGVMLAIRLLRRPRWAPGFRRSSPPFALSLGSELARSFAISIASTTGRRLAQGWVKSL